MHLADFNLVNSSALFLLPLGGVQTIAGDLLVELELLVISLLHTSTARTFSPSCSSVSRGEVH